jgi:hypothetical protein
VLNELPEVVGDALAKFPNAVFRDRSSVLENLGDGSAIQGMSSLFQIPSSFSPLACDGIAQWKESSDGLQESFWMSVQYCGFLRCTYEGGGVSPSAIILNDAYASLSGMERDELIAR